MSALITAALGFLPGAFFSVLLRRRPSLSGFVTDSIAFSLLVSCALFWFPILYHVRFDVWVEVLYGLSALGLAAVPVVLMRIDWTTILRVSRYQAGLRAATLLAIAFYTLIVLVRANIDWDAITYYLFDAVNFAKSNHVSLYFSSWVVPVANAPNTQPPALPILYAAAINTAARLHENADLAIRLLSITFVLGLWAAVHRLARRYLSPTASDAASLIAITLPMVIALVVATPLYLDMAITFLSAAVLAELSYLDQSRRGWLRIALYASATILTKITGLGIVVFAALAFSLARMHRKIATIIIVALYVAFLLVSLRLGFFTGVSGVWLTIALCATFALTACAVHAHARAQRPVASAPVRIALVVLGLLPGIAFVAELVWLTGSPAGGYIQTVTHVHSPHWNWALKTIAASTPYLSAIRPGLPEHFGLGLLFWWGLAPVTNLFAAVGLIRAIRKREPIGIIAVAALIYEFAWLTIFRLDDFRHLMPIAPVIAVLAAYAVQHFTENREEAMFYCTIGLVAAAVPFAWIAQETFFTISYAILLPLNWTQYFSVSTKALWDVALYCVAAGSLFLSPWLSTRGAPRAMIIAIGTAGAVCIALLSFSSLAVGLAFIACACLLWLGVRTPGYARRLVPFYVLVVVMAMFEPVLATGLGEGFRPHEAAVKANEDAGYVAALQNAIANVNSTAHSASKPVTVMTYLGYGISWFSLGSLRPLELNDALILGRLRDEMRQNQIDSLYRVLARYNISLAILPSRSSRTFASLHRLLQLANLDIFYALYDPLIASKEHAGMWVTLEVYPRSTVPHDTQALLDLHGAGKSVIASDGAARFIKGQPFNTISVSLGKIPTQHGNMAHFRIALADASNEVRKLDLQAVVRRGKISIGLQSLANRVGTSRLDLRAVDVKYSGSELDFRSSGFELQRAGSGFSIVQNAAPFVLFPESSPVRDISLGSSPAGLAFSLYPVLADKRSYNADALMNITLRGAPGCENTSHVRVTVSGRLTSAEEYRFAEYKRVVPATIPSTVSIRLGRFTSAPAKGAHIVVDTIAVDGVGTACPVHVRINAHRLTLTKLQAGRFALKNPVRHAMTLDSVSFKSAHDYAAGENDRPYSR